MSYQHNLKTGEMNWDSSVSSEDLKEIGSLCIQNVKFLEMLKNDEIRRAILLQMYPFSDNYEYNAHFKNMMIRKSENSMDPAVLDYVHQEMVKDEIDPKHLTAQQLKNILQRKP